MQKSFAKIMGASGSTLPRDIITLIVIVLGLSLPFINQAFHWDDRDFIEFAQAKANDFTQFTLHDYSYKGRHASTLRDPHAPLLTNYLSLFLRAGASVSEPLFHGAYLIFPLIGALSMFFIARRFTRHPLIAAMLLIVTPGYLVMSHNLMDGLPGLSLLLLSTALFIPGVDRGNWKLLVASGVAMAFAVMTAYQAFTVVPLLALYAILNRDFKLRTYLIFAIPLGVYFGWRYYMTSRYGKAPAISYQVKLHADWQIRSIVAFVGGSTIFPISVIAVFIRKKLDVLVAFLALPPLITWASLYYLGSGDLDIMQAVEMAVYVAAGFLIFYRLVWEALSAYLGRAQKAGGWADPAFLLGWFAGSLVVLLAFNIPFVAVRHMLLMFPPVILIFIREAERLWPMRPRLRGFFIYGTLVLTAMFGLSAAVADYRMANVYRDTAAQMKARYADSPVKIWALGEFDFRYYMEKEGFEYLGVDSVANQGDIVISSYVCSTGVLAPLPEGYYRVLQREEPTDTFPVRTMNPWADAGFYGNLMGLLPVSFSTSKMDEIDTNELFWNPPENVDGGNNSGGVGSAGGVAGAGGAADAGGLNEAGAGG